MDFDDLDDAIDERIAAGDTDGMENFAFQKKDLKKFEGELPPMPTSKGIWVQKFDGERPVPIKHRAFVFYGPGHTAQDLGNVATTLDQTFQKSWFEIGVFEWPGHGSRKDESFAENVDALAQDAFDALKPALEQVKEDAEYEGAPFSFIGASVGCQVMTVVAKKVLMNYGMAPSACVVMDRGAPQFPLLSEEGQKVLESDPDSVVKAFSFKNFTSVNKESYAKGLRYACDTRDPFYHKFDCDMLVLKGELDAAMNEKGKKSTKFKMTTLQIKGSNECFQMPVDNGTTVSELMNTVSSIFAYTRGTKVKAFAMDGKEIQGFDKVVDDIVVEGLEDFKHPRYCWPHPICIIGAGFFGVKTAMEYHLNKNYNIVLFDRLKNAGGYAWHLSATKYSRVQTDYGAFNIWWGHQYSYTGEAERHPEDPGFGTEAGGRKQFSRAFLGPGSPMNGTVPSGAGTGHDANPVRAQVIGALQFAIKEYGIEDSVRYETEVSTLKIIGDPDWEGRCYKLGLTDLRSCPEKLGTRKLGEGEALEDIKVSVIYHYPGAYDINRIVNYPGESEFGGQIGYGMGNGQGGMFCWDDGNMKGARAAILGNGAFAVENVRSCVEQGASKVYIFTRRKSLLCPRMPCWFCHQGPVPTHASFLLDMFKPMYAAAGVGDPWKNEDFYAVTGSDKMASIRQSSRFGIGDIAFLAHAIGLFEYRVGVIERLTYKTAHLSTGEAIGLDHICKALGLIGDPRVDQLHAMTYRLGNLINGDWRRIISADATGMDAKRFTTFSAGPGACGMVKTWYYLHNRPWEMLAGMKKEEWGMIQKHTISDTQPDQPCYMTNVQYEMFAGNVFGSCVAGMGRAHGDESTYKYALIHTMHPTDKYLEYCKADWDRYQNLIKENTPGFENMEWVPYPYTKEMVQKWFNDYPIKHDIPISIDGPPESLKKTCLEDYRRQVSTLNDELIPQLIKESKMLKCEEDEDPYVDALTSTVHNLKKNLTGSEPGSSMNFDDAHIEAWKDCMSSDYSFHSMPVGETDMMTGYKKPLASSEVLYCGFVWAFVVAPFLEDPKGFIKTITAPPEEKKKKSTTEK